jgi:hypothetical protein
MIGFIAGLGLLFSYLGAAWTIDNTEGSLFNSGLAGAFLILGVVTVIGIFLFPRTVGTAFTPMSLATPVAFLIALFRNGFMYSLFILAVGAGAWLVTFILGRLRPDAT